MNLKVFYQFRIIVNLLISNHAFIRMKLFSSGARTYTCCQYQDCQARLFWRPICP
jgi:hypothetical protein